MMMRFGRRNGGFGSSSLVSGGPRIDAGVTMMMMAKRIVALFSSSSSSKTLGGGGFSAAGAMCAGGGRRAYAKATKKASTTTSAKAVKESKRKSVAKTTTTTTTGGGGGVKKKKKTSVVMAGKKEMGVRTDAPPKVEKVHVLPHLPVVVRNALSSSSSAPSFAAAAATTSAAATAARSRASTTAGGGHRTDAPPRMDKVTVLSHLPARADGGWIAPSSSSTSTSSSTTTKTVGAVGAAGGEGASAAAAFEQKQHQNVNAEGLDFSTVASALAGMAIVVGGIYSVVSSSSSGRESAKNKNKTKNPKKNREELNDGEGHHEPLLAEVKAATKSAIESKEDDNTTSAARNAKTKKEEEEERLAEDLLIQKLREDAAKLVEEEFTRAFVPDASTSPTSSSTAAAVAAASSPSSSSSSSEEASRPPLYEEKEVAKELAEVFEAASELLIKNMDPADASSSSQKQEQLENNVEASKLDRALDELALKQANVQALETKMREMEKQHVEDLEKNEREHALKAEETVLAERAKRVKQLDEERVRFGALKTVLSSRRKALEEAKIAHEIVAGVSKLSEKIEKGESFAREMRVLKKVAENDDVLRALLSVTEKTLDRLASKDVPTVAQLRDALEKQVKRDARRVYLIPKEGGGMLAHAVASLASLIKVEEVVGKDNNTSLEAAISKVEMLLRDDRDSVGDAARILLKASEHSKAKDVVQSWATSAMEREEIDFILRSLIAHANAKSSGV